MYGFLRLTFLSVLSQPQIIHAYKLINHIKIPFTTFYSAGISYSTFSNDNTSHNTSPISPNENKNVEFKGRLIYINGTNKHLYDGPLETLLGSGK